ncbi:hypothetical protein C9994_12850 [Marivirga lumbricoides]|uniref:Lipoprotein n=1 Tax=Marivirga lumbricoides TaxID=1046115 RepID=A0A2T4DIH1_9BACT|nr:hypothetical protein C9994_12850 [Marivirga lumbricoides]
MKKLILILAIVVLFSCSIQKKNIIGQYNSSCALYGNQASIVLKVNSDSTFSYARPYVEKLITGNWKVVNRKLILDSPEFSDSLNSDYLPKIKYTSAYNVDVYLVKNNKLLKADESGFTKECHLVKVKSYSN